MALALLSFLVLPLATWISDWVGRKREALTYEQQGRIAQMSSAVQESLSLSGIVLARTMGRTAHLTQLFARSSREVATLEVRSHTAGQWQWSVIDLVLQAMPALTLLLGGWLMASGTAMTVGTLVAMIALQEQLLFPLEEVLRSGVEVRKTRALFARIFEYLDEPVGITERPDPVTLDPAKVAGHVRLDRVAFSTTGQDRPPSAASPSTSRRGRTPPSWRHRIGQVHARLPACPPLRRGCRRGAL